MSDQVAARLQGINRLLESLKVHTEESLISEHFSVKGDADDYLSVMATATELKLDPSTIRFFKPGASAAQIAGRLTSRAKEGDLSARDVMATESMSHIGVDWSWDGTLDAVETLLSSGNALEPPALASGIRFALTLEFLHGIEKAHSVNAQLVVGGLAYSRLHEAQTNEDVEGQAACALLCLFHMSDDGIGPFQGPALSGGNSFQALVDKPDSNIALLDSLVAEAVRLGALESCLKRVHSDSVGSLAIQLVRQGIVTKKAEITPAMLWKYWEELVTALEEDEFADAVDEALEQGLIAEVVELGFSPEKAEIYVALSRAASSREDVNLPRLNQFLSEGLKATNSEAWRDALSEDGHLLDLLVVTQGWSEDRPTLGEAIAHPLDELARGLAKGKRDLPDRSDWSTVTSSLESGYLKTLLANARDLLRGAPSDWTPLLTLFGDRIIDAGWDKNQLDEVVRMRFPEMLERSVASELNFMQELGKQEGIKKRLAKETLTDFEVRLRDASEEATADTIEVLNGIADAWGFSWEESVEETTTSEPPDESDSGNSD